MTEHLLFPDISLCLALGLGTEDNRDGSFREAGVPGGGQMSYIRAVQRQRPGMGSGGRNLADASNPYI